MLEINLCLDPAQIAPYCKKCGKLHGPSFYLYLATNRGQRLAAGLFEVASDRVAAVWYESETPEDYFLFDAVLRAGLGYADGQGIASGYIPEAFRTAHAAAFGKLNYPAQPLFDITNFFQKYKSCNMNQL